MVLKKRMTDQKNIYLGGVINIKDAIDYKRNISIFEKNLLWANVGYEYMHISNPD